MFEKKTLSKKKHTKTGVVLWELWTGLEPWAEVSPVGVVGAVGFGGATLPLGDEEEEEEGEEGGAAASTTTTTTTAAAAAAASTSAVGGPRPAPRVTIGDKEGQIPPAIAKLIRKCWAPLPADRPSFSSCIDDLNAFLKSLLIAAAASNSNNNGSAAAGAAAAAAVQQLCVLSRSFYPRIIFMIPIFHALMPCKTKTKKT